MEAGFQKKVATIAILLASTATSLPAFSQDAKEELQMLDEVVVTARKREESLQESPVAISAFSAESLREAGVSTMRDLSTSVPGLSFSEMGSKASSIFIRGIGQKESSAALDPSVGVYINGLYIARTDTQLLDTVDTESVQVLRGPQGTLFGKNTTAGAMLVTTKSPNTEAFSGTAASKVGNFGRRDAKLFLNIPLNDDSLSMRAAVNSVKRDGYMKNVINDREFGDEERVAATARILWEASDVFSADLFTYISKQNENGGAFTCILGNPGGRIVGQLSYPGAAGTSETSSFADSCRQSEALADDNKVALNDSAFRLTNELVGLTLSWDLEDFEIKSITGFSHQQDIVVEDDQDGAGLQTLQNGTITRDSFLSRSGIPVDDEKRSQISQEINLIGSAFDETLSYTVGLFYSQESMDNTPFTQVVGPNTFSSIDQLTSPSNVAAAHKFLGTQSNLDTATSALFAQGTYDVTDWFQLTLGARYTSEKRERDLSVYTIDFNQFAAVLDQHGYPTSQLLGGAAEGLSYTGGIPEFNNAAAAYANGDFNIPLNAPVRTKEDKTWSKFTPALTLTFNHLENYLNWDNLDSAMVYLTYSKGFKAGGFEPRGTELRKFEPEEVKNYELGAKFDSFDRRLRINGAFYYMDYSNMQVRVAEAGARVTDLYLYLSNAGEATIKGFELEMSALPIDNLTVSATFNYTDAAYDEFSSTEVYADPGQLIPTPHTVDRSDEPYAVTPKKSGSLTVSYNIETEAAGLFVPRLTAYYRDEVYIGMDYRSPEFDQSTLDPYTLLSARLSWMPNDQWNVTAFVDNVTDKDYYQGGFALMDALGAANVVKGPPRMYGVEAYYEF